MLVLGQLKSLFAYINDPNEIQNEFIQHLDKRVQQYNFKGWRRIQVTLEHMLLDKKRDCVEGLLRSNALFDKLF